MVCKGIVFIFKITNKFAIFFKTIRYTCFKLLISAINQALKHVLKNISYVKM